jgi:predicted Ser/Thr protein kinase
VTQPHQCPSCRRTFEEGGFCPFDRSPLVSLANPDAQTLISAQIQAAKGYITRPYEPDSMPEEAKRTQVSSPGIPIPSEAIPTDAKRTSVELPAATAHAALDDKRTQVDPRRTFPVAGAPVGPGTEEVTSARARPLPAMSAVAGPASEPPRQRMSSVSAAQDTGDALAAIKKQAKGGNEYDRLVGETLDGRYFVEKKIGEGGMGVVFAARHSVIERPLAIKVLKREVMRDTATIKRFIQEAKAASRIGHPNIVDVTDFGTTPDGMTYSVMEYITGQTLGHALRHGSFPASRAIKIAVQIARALGAAHDKGIVHRDLKPENIFLVERDNRTDFVKIVDFGIAKVVPSQGANPNEPRLTRAGSVFGTPEYMAPEQAAGKSDTDGRVDIYALGVLLYEMLTGRVPHRGDSTVRTLAMVMLDPVEPPSRLRNDGEITPELEAVVLHALAKKREARYQTMSELVTDLEAVMPVVGKSITGAPVYALAPLPPGATPVAAMPSIGSASYNSTGGGSSPAIGVSIDDAARHARPAVDSSSRRAHRDSGPGSIGAVGPVTHRAHEPQFTSRDKPQTFEHVFTSETPLQQRKRWPLAIGGLLILGGAATALALIIASSRDRSQDQPRDAAIVQLLPDAATITQTEDAAPPSPDAPDIVVVDTPDARVVVSRPPPRLDAGVVVAMAPDAAPFSRGVIIQVITKPEGANLYAGYSYTGPGGTNIERPIGSKLDLECRMSGYKPGKVHLEFDGKTEYAMCVLERIKICVKELKNPFDECQDDPAPKPGP